MSLIHAERSETHAPATSEYVSLSSPTHSVGSLDPSACAQLKRGIGTALQNAERSGRRRPIQALGLETLQLKPSAHSERNAQVRRVLASPGSDPNPGNARSAVAQCRFSSKQLEWVRGLPSSIRVEYLAHVSDEEWQQVLDADIFEFFGGTEEVDQIREERKYHKEMGNASSSEWLEVFPEGNARKAAEQLAMLDADEDVELDQLISWRDAFLTLARKKVRVAYLEDLEIDDSPALLPGDQPRKAEFLHPTEELWLAVPDPGKSLFFLGYIVARKADAVEVWRNHLLSGVRMSGEDGYPLEVNTGDPEVDELSDLMSGLSLDNSLDSRIVPMEIDKVVSGSGLHLTKTRYDADGDVIMEDSDGFSDVHMTDVHGHFNIDFKNVTGYVSMEIEDVQGNVDMEIEDLHGSLHLVMMDIDLGSEDHMEIDVEDVAGAMEIEVLDYDQAMEVDLGHIQPGAFKRYRFAKRKREESDEELGELTKSKRQKLEQETDDGAESLEDLIGKFSALSISFRTGLDKELHMIYPARNLNDLIVASDPTPLKSIIANKAWLGKGLTSPEVSQLKTLKSGVESALKSVKSSASQTNNNALAKAMRKVAKFLSKKGTVDIPDTDLSGSTNHGTASNKTSTVVGKKVVADPLSPKSTAGGSVAQDGALMDSLRTKVQTAGGSTKDPVQAHLLNMKTWGPGELWNLTPASKQFNSDMESDIETPLKAALYERGIVMYFEAEVSYNNYPVGLDHATAPEKYLFTKITFKAYQLHEDTVNNQWVQDHTIANDAKVQAVNRKMNWKQGNLPKLLPSPNAHTGTAKKPLQDLGFPASVIEALTTYNAAVAVGNKIPGTASNRPKWPGNVGVDTFLGDLQVWLDSAKSSDPGKYSGSQKKVAGKANLPANWKQVLDFS